MLSGLEAEYQQGSLLNVSCQTSPGFPPPSIDWAINGQKVRERETSQCFRDFKGKIPPNPIPAILPVKNPHTAGPALLESHRTPRQLQPRPEKVPADGEVDLGWHPQPAGGEVHRLHGWSLQGHRQWGGALHQDISLSSWPGPGGTSHVGWATTRATSRRREMFLLFSCRPWSVSIAFCPSFCTQNTPKPLKTFLDKVSGC